MTTKKGPFITHVTHANTCLNSQSQGRMPFQQDSGWLIHENKHTVHLGWGNVRTGACKKNKRTVS